ncbi:heptaprenyl diphosphate synthase component 1 [Ammoniphilus sp. CFH 90114]|uniref:heptaprenyl diphosphate synthase component 1 n=1 Tax=Ammoniphilus sp. CFH 90114 TaxID=2493665 RepID=UPI00100DDD66|nr:heptaprenyl diphosphate synthase component 1 [Ammoniphilus sp. CFH 90114]RXT13902.1 hypothetical protein EIZ39_07135 [Ammoniphilus sp. CFH 90114]
MILTNPLFREELAEIIEEVNKHIKCDYVQRYVEIPSIPLLRMQVLFLFLHDSNVAREQIKHYLVSTTLIQLGLDCHEKVTLVPQYSEGGIRNRQLSVLAGDLFSSKYYFLLSNIGDVALIRELARSIYRINEVKTMLYTGTGWSKEESLDMRNEIDSALYTSFIPRFASELGLIWHSIIEQFCLIERYAEGLMDYRLGQAIGEKSENDFYPLFQSRIEQSIQELKGKLGGLRNEEVKQEIHHLIEAYQKQGVFSHSIT